MMTPKQQKAATLKLTMARCEGKVDAEILYKVMRREMSLEDALKEIKE